MESLKPMITRNRTYYFIIGFGIVIFLTYFFFNSKREKYLNNYYALDDRRMNSVFQYPFVFYFINHFECPKNLEEVVDLPINDPDYQSYYNMYFKDFLHKNGNEPIHYQPVYNVKNKKREAFLLLSSGIDGKIDNKFDSDDTLFTSDWINKLSIYNPSSFYKIGDTIKELEPPKFNILDYFFGRKDYLIEYINCIDYYLSQARDTLTAQEIVEKSIAGKVRTRIWAIEGVVTGDTHLYDHTCLFFKYKDYTIENWMYNGLIDFQFHLNDSLLLTGYYVDFDDQLKIIRMRNCIPMTQ